LKLALGTAQFGLSYGIANKTGRVPLNEAREILAEAARHGIDVLDTAIDYGESESTLGEIGVSGFRVVSKLPTVPEDCNNVVDWVTAQLVDSLVRINTDRLYAVLLHRPQQILGARGDDIIRALQRVKSIGLTEKVGLSVYSIDEFAPLFVGGNIDIVQAPFSLLDRRLLQSGWMSRFHEEGIELHVRSIFLQGLLLLTRAQLPKEFSRWRKIWEEWERWQNVTGLAPLAACVRYALSIREIDKIVVGVDSLRQLQEIFAAGDREIPCLPDWPDFIDTALINPPLWGVL
jgi:aryl-alcohol dehydrogenase-like predicted oxidoreductase